MSNEKGITLVELLAALTITSLIVIFIISIQVTIQKQYQVQTESSEQLTDITIAMKSITKDLRSAEMVDVSDDYTSISIDETTYELHDDRLKKNGSNYLYNIAEFYVFEDDGKINISIQSNTGKMLKTDIVLREGD